MFHFYVKRFETSLDLYIVSDLKMLALEIKH